MTNFIKSAEIIEDDRQAGAGDWDNNVDATVERFAFNGNRVIKRAIPGLEGVNLNKATVKEMLEEMLYPFIPATISINGSSVHEVGSNPTITISGSITAHDETVFSNGKIKKDGVDWQTFASSPYSQNDTVNKNVVGIFSYQAFTDVGGNGTPGTINSVARTASFIFPFLYGLNTDNTLVGTAFYDAMTKSVSGQGNKVITFNGTGTLIQFGYPDDYPDLTSIKDPNGFEVIGSFTKVTKSVTSTGLANNYTKNFKVYILNAPASPAGNFTFTF